MKKTIFKCVCLLLVAVMLLTCCIACKSDEAAEGETSDTVSTDTDTQKGKKTEAELPDVNYGGYKFNILVRNNQEKMDDLKVDSYGSNEVDNAVFNRDIYMKETFGIEITLVPSDPTADMGAVAVGMDTIQAGECDYDLIAAHGRAAGTYAINGCCLDWNKLKWVDLECDWWTQDAVDSYTINGRLYFMLGDLSYIKEGQTICMYFNKDILDDAGIEYPYQMALDGNWTLQEFTTMAKQAYNSMDKTNTGKLADDSFAYTTGWWRGPMQLLFSTGHKVITGNSSTEFALDLYNETTIKAYKEYLDDFVFSGICNNESPGNYDNMQKAFKAGRVAFYDDLIGVSHVFDGVNFGILPWPKYDTNVDGYPTVIGAEANFFIVPKTASETERTSVVLEAMSFYGYKNIVDTYFNEVLSYKYSPDAESMEILKLIKAGRLYDIGGVYRFGNDDLECISNMGYLLYKNGMNGSKASSISGIYSAYSGIAKQKFDDWGDID